MNYIIIVLLLMSYIFPKCDGFNWYHDINLNDCHKNDIWILQEFITLLQKWQRKNHKEKIVFK